MVIKHSLRRNAVRADIDYRLLHQHGTERTLSDMSSLPRSEHSRRGGLDSWRSSLYACSLAAVAVFMINVAFAIAVATKSGFVDGRGVLGEGDCSKTRAANVGIHLVINVLSTVLLASSNYTMQILSAPTRKDIDAAHAEHKWMDVGVPSLRNLKRISRKRAVLWVILACSSMPFHLFYNSAVFSTLSTNEYTASLVTRNFLEGSAFNYTDSMMENRGNLSEDRYSYFQYYDYWTTNRTGDLLRALQVEAGADKLERLESAECASIYSVPFQFGRSHVLLVADSDIEDNPIIDSIQWTFAYHPRDGPSCYVHQYTGCEQGPVGPMIERKLYHSDHQNKTVDYCLSKRSVEHCKIEVSEHLLVIVIVFSLLKALSMAYVAFSADQAPILNIGDALASFLEEPDANTREIRLASQTDFEKIKTPWSVSKGCDHLQRQRRLWSAAHVRRWVVCVSLYVVATLAVFGLLIRAIRKFEIGRSRGDEKVDPLGPLRLGFGSLTPGNIISWDVPSHGAGGLIANVIIANIAQCIFSVLYFAYNALFTYMAQAQEWSEYAFAWKSLRVSTRPYYRQRTTRFLTLPYIIALPLMVTSAAIHWLVSLSIFVVSVDVYGLTDSSTDLLEPELLPKNAILTCGYTAVAMLIVVIIGIIMVLVLLTFGAQKLRPGSPPLVGSCSAAIASACHPAASMVDPDAALGHVRWGVVIENEKEYYAFYGRRRLVEELGEKVEDRYI